MIPIGLGLGASLGQRFGATSSFTMSSVAWTGWFDGAARSGATITGKASAGNSGSHNFEALGSPVAGTINGQTTILLDGSNDYIRYVTGGATADLTNPTSWTVSCVCKITSSPTDSANPYSNPSIGGGAGAFWAIGVDSANHVEAYQYVGGAQKIATAAWSAGVLTLFQARYDGANISIRVGKGAWTNTASGTPTTETGTFKIGADYNLTQYLTGEICEYAISDVSLSTATLDSVADAMAAKWGVSV